MSSPLGRGQFPDDLVPGDMDLELNGEDGESIVGTVVVTDGRPRRQPFAGRVIFDRSWSRSHPCSGS
jgi:hypothetical protein